MLALAAAGLIHVLASDSHSSRGGRPLQISDGLAVLGQVELLSHISTGSRARRRRRSCVASARAAVRPGLGGPELDLARELLDLAP